MEAAEARELIEEAIEETEARHDEAEATQRKAERRFRDRVSLLVGVFALLLALIHMGAAGAQRDSLLTAIEGSDTYAYMEAKIVRETVLVASANAPGLEGEVRARELGEAVRLRQGGGKGHGIEQLQQKADKLREESRAAATRSEGLELGETALQLAIVLLSIALITQNWRLVAGACVMAGLGCLAAVLAMLGVAL